MITFPPSFIDLVKSSILKTDKFYNSQSKVCNPYYIGFGNPNADILIIGQEKAIGVNDLDRIKVESIDNPLQWTKLYTQKINDHFYKFPNPTDFLNPFQPYKNRAKGNGRGQTWFYYQKLISFIHPEILNKPLGNSFFEKTFITELNHQTSLKKRGYKPNPHREGMWKSEFFKSFPVTVLAAGNYLSQKQVEKLFNVKKTVDYSQP